MTSFSSALVTGASGFIGTALVKFLINNNIKTYCLVRKISNKLPAAVHQLIISDFTPDAILQATATIQADVIFHLAAYGVLPDARDPLITAQVNIHAVVALLETAKNWHLKQFIHIGSCAEYGTPITNELITENHPLNPLSIYGASKAAAALYLSSVARAYQLPFTHLRLFGVYGPGEADYRLAPYVIKNLMENKTALLSPGLQIRDFLYINDVVVALIKAADLIEPYGIYNICSGEGIAVNVVAKTIARILNQPETLLDFTARPMRPDETMWLVGNNKKFSDLTGWKLKYDLEHGLEETVQFMGVC